MFWWKITSMSITIWMRRLVAGFNWLTVTYTMNYLAKHGQWNVIRNHNNAFTSSAGCYHLLVLTCKQTSHQNLGNVLRDIGKCSLSDWIIISNFQCYLFFIVGQRQSRSIIYLKIACSTARRFAKVNTEFTDVFKPFALLWQEQIWENRFMKPSIRFFVVFHCIDAAGSKQTVWFNKRRLEDENKTRIQRKGTLKSFIKRKTEVMIFFKVKNEIDLYRTSDKLKVSPKRYH